MKPVQIANLFENFSPRDRTAWLEQAVRNSGKGRDYWYRQAKLGGWRSGRKKRADTGSIRAAITEDDFLKIAKVKMEATRANGKQIAGTETAVALVHGAPLMVLEGIPTVRTINRHLSRLGLSPQRLKKVRVFEKINKETGEIKTYISEATNILSSDYPNQIHQVDTSTCIIYSFHKSKQLKIISENQLYKNKPQNFIRLINKRKLIIRYILVDHCSGAFYVHYYEAGGENSADMGDFLFYAWSEKSYPFRGVPDTLQSDPGAGLNNQMIQIAFERLEVNWYHALTGNKEANGLVESMHNVWECAFESMLRFTTVPDIEELNRLAEKMCAYINNNKLHSKLKATRSAVWSMIPEDKLREIPPFKEHFQSLMLLPETRKVAPSGLISFEGLAYRTDNPELCGQQVTVWHSPYKFPAIDIHHEATDYRATLEPIPTNRYGRLETGANVATGTFNCLPESRTVKNVRRALGADISEIDSSKLIEKMGELAKQPVFIGSHKEGEEIPLETPATVFDTRFAAKKYIIEKYGNPGPDLLAEMNRLLPANGITPSQAEAAYLSLTSSPDQEAFHARQA